MTITAAAISLVSTTLPDPKKGERRNYEERRALFEDASIIKGIKMEPKGDGIMENVKERGEGLERLGEFGEWESR